MNRIKPLFIPQRDGPLPQPKLDTAKVKRRLEQAGFPAAQHGEIVTMLRLATADYMFGKTVDEGSATPKQVEVYLDRARSAVRELHAVLGQSSDDPAAKAIVQRIMVSGNHAAGWLDDLKLGAAQFLKAAETVAALAGPPRKGGGTEAKRARQVRFAKGFIDTFEANGWPMETKHNGLMAQLLAICLKAAGDETATPDRLLRDAKKNS